LEYGLAATSFGVAYLLQIVTTHLLFAVLVYGLNTINTPEKYFKTLWGQFRVYFVSLIGSTALNSYLIHRHGVDRTMAFFGTMTVSACINYVLISWIVKRAVQSAEHHSNMMVDVDQITKTKTIQGKQTNQNSHQMRKQKQNHNYNNNHPKNTLSRGWIMDKFQRGGALFGWVVPSLAS
jgi:hypothetical protein